MDLTFDNVGQFPASDYELQYLTELSAAHPQMSKFDLLSWLLVAHCLHQARESVSRKSPTGHHVLAADLLGVVRTASLQTFGEDARAWLVALGIRSSRDFGATIYRFIEMGALNTLPEDEPEDFHISSDLDAFLVERNQPPEPTAEHRSS